MLGDVVHRGCHQRLAIISPAPQGIVLPKLALVAGETTHQRINARSPAPPTSSQAKWASSAMHTGPRVFLPVVVEVRTDHRICTAAANPGGTQGCPRKHLHRVSLSSSLGEVTCS